MLVPTLPESRFLILDDADMASLVSIALVAERWGGAGPEPLVIPAWWRAEADTAMPLVHAAVDRPSSFLKQSFRCIKDVHIIGF